MTQEKRCEKHYGFLEQLCPSCTLERVESANRALQAEVDRLRDGLTGVAETFPSSAAMVRKLLAYTGTGIVSRSPEHSHSGDEQRLVGLLAEIGPLVGTVAADGSAYGPAVFALKDMVARAYILGKYDANIKEKT